MNQATLNKRFYFYHLLNIKHYRLRLLKIVNDVDGLLQIRLLISVKKDFKTSKKL